MKFFYLLFSLILISCVNVKKEYVCGDRPCVDHKEFKEFFAKNLTVEILDQKKKKNQKIDLVKLNTRDTNLKKKDSNTSKKNDKLRKKAKKEKLKAEKIRLLEERKIKKAERKQKIIDKKLKNIEESRSTKIFSSDEELGSDINELENDKKLANNVIKDVNNQSKIKKIIPNEIFETNQIKSKNVKSICNENEDCDIDMIAEKLIKRGRDKPFPSITSN